MPSASSMPLRPTERVINSRALAWKLLDRQRVGSMGDGMEVEAELLSVGEQDGGQPGDPPREQGLLAGARGAVGVVGGEALLGQDVQPGEEAERLVEVEIADMTASLLVEQLQGQQAQQRRGGRDHLGAGIARLCDQGIEAEAGEQG